MSGSPRLVHLAADVDGLVARLVHAAAVLGQASMPPWALVGGMAVMVQLAEAHRATADVDTVADDDSGQLGPALAILAAEQHGSATGTRVVLEDGTTIDVITTGSWVAEDLPDDDLDRIFVLAHWWAVQTAEVVELRVVEGAEIAMAAEIAVARPAALVACKLQSSRRRQRDQAKAASDLHDIYRLLAEHDRDGGVAAALATGPEDLGRWCADAMTETFVTDASRSARRLGTGARGPAMAAVRAIDLEVVGALCAGAIRDALA